MKTDKRLARYVTGTNAVADYAKVLLAHILPQLNQYIGKKIFTADGSKAKLFVVDLGELKPKAKTDDIIRDAGTFLHYQYGNLSLRQRICITGDPDKNHVSTYCEYFDREIEIGKVENQILIDVANKEAILKNYGFDTPIVLADEVKKLEALKAVMEQATKIKDTLRVGSEFYKYF